MGVVAVFLIGFMGSGKSSVGQELARRLHWDFVDLDRRIESREGKTIAEIFRDQGEPGFRVIEAAALQELVASLQRNTVVGLGGGAFVQAQNRQLIARWPSVFLEAPIDELWRRSEQDPGVRPLRRNREQFARLYAERLPHYRQATVAINTADRDVTSVCGEIEKALQLTGPA